MELISRGKVLAVCFSLLAIPLFLFGCESDDTGPKPPVGGSKTATTSAPSATAPGATEQMQPAFTSRLSLTVPDADAFLADDVAKKAVINGIADAYNVSSSYVTIKFSKAAARLLEAALRRMGSALQIDYTISVPASAAVAVKQDMLKRASNLTAETMHTAIKARVQVAKGAKFVVGMQVTSLSAPQTITTTTTKQSAVAKPTTTVNNPVANPTQTTKTNQAAGPQATTTTTTFTSVRTQAADAQFLMQATFGPTRASLAALQSTNYIAWLREQMALPVESHRAYYRARSNPRFSVETVETLKLKDNNPPGSPRSPCAQGSRWLRFAFSKSDVGKNISVKNNKIYVGGVLRTDIDPAYTGNGLSAPSSPCTNNKLPNSGSCSTKASACRKSTYWATHRNGPVCEQTCYNLGLGYNRKDCSRGWPSLNLVGYICDVDEVVAGWVGWSTSRSCTTQGMRSSQGMKNPAIWFADVAKIPNSKASMRFNELRPGVVLLSQTASSCNFGNFMRHDGKVFMHDARLDLVSNTLEKPAVAVAAPVVDVCATAPKTFLNEKACKLESTCTPLHLKKSIFVLNSTSFQTFYKVGGKYVYEIVGLRQASSPCGTTSRWKKVDCKSGSCSATSLSASDISLIVAALQLSGGSLRDISVNCKSVAAKATVQVGSEFFINVHTHEHNVFDFSKWVDSHPGGKAKITQWVNNGFKMTFPGSHPMTRFEAGTTQNKIFLLGRVGDLVDFSTLPTDLQTPVLAAAFSSAGSTKYFQACGSPNEVANDPSLGNELAFWYNFVGGVNKHLDRHLDKPYVDYKTVPERFSKTEVWTMKALYGKDQLRQRMAWALSQIFVTATPGYKYDHESELWSNYYDIFVRNAFTNFRDILREITYSPVMGDYLTFRRNTAYDVNLNYPDENYAREIMQLFTIGLFKLHPNGSKVLDAKGDYVRMYSNEHVMNFARVFTGFDRQLSRGNIESIKGSVNLIDPMRMREEWHDIYPKNDLNGNYIGDGYPLCSDIPPRAFLAKGAKYSFLGYVYTGSYVKTLNQNSALYKALCASSGACKFALNTQLGSSLACYSEECKMDMVEVVKVGNGYFEYVPPSCVHLYFFNGQVSVRGDRFNNKWQQKCEDRGMQAAGTACCGAKEVRVCGQPFERVRFSVANATCTSLGLAVCNKKIATASCGYDKKQVWTPKTCQTTLEIDSDGKVTPKGSSEVKTSQVRLNKFAVQWLNGFPTAAACPSGCTAGADTCTCSVVVRAKKVFNKVPSKAELKANLAIGALAPTTVCTSCNGEVKSYLASSGVIDENTVFESDGRYYKNFQSVATVGGFECRNPPVFMYGNRYSASSGLPTERAAIADVEALLDHLFHHPNTPVFFSSRLIQRFGNSNPSPTYIYDVAEAFRTGKYGGNTYSGKYGDLAATVASILLHPEARNPQSSTQGSLREPVIKLVHFLRSMEFVDSNHSELVLYDLDDVIGQEPFKSSSVFNFYQPDYQPSSFSGGVVAPEFQIFTAPFAVGFLNGLMSMVDYGGVSACNKGLGHSYDSKSYRASYCQVGKFQLQEKSSADETISELNLLLTGGRLTSVNQTKRAYTAAAAGDKFKAAQRAIVLSPEFHTIGNPLAAGSRSSSSAPAPSPASSYKATVMLFMHGGADTFNMLVPYEGALWSEYKAVRKDIALASHELLEITTVGQKISKFAVHKKLPFVRQLYADGQAAFVSNIGALVEPMTKEQYKKGGATRCVGLFSHSDQQTAAATLKCQIAGTSPKGAGGRIADALKANGHSTFSFSVSGTSAWSEGFRTNQEIIHHKQGPVRLKTYSTVAPLLRNITREKHKNVYCEEYAKSISKFVESSEVLGNTLDGVKLKTSYATNDNLQMQFHQVARLIAARTTRKVERDLFYVKIGGFDTHSDNAEILEEKFTSINDALQGFVTELKAQNIFDSVVIASESDFGRTLSTNGAGTDHAWAGNHFVIGGKINGGKVYNDYPSSLLAGNEQDIGRLRLIPKYPWENIMVPIAEWMGVKESDHPTVFPNLGKFSRGQHILAKSTLFKA